MTSQVTHSSMLQVLSLSNPQQFPGGEMLFVDWAQCTGFPCRWWIAPSPGEQTLAMAFQCLLRTQQRDLQTAVTVHMYFMNEWKKEWIDGLELSARNRPKTPVRQWGRQASSGSLLAGYFPHIWSLLLQLLWRESGKGSRMASLVGNGHAHSWWLTGCQIPILCGSPAC